MTKQITTTDVVPQRIAADHYQMQSSTGMRTYDITFDHEAGRWNCNCPDVRHNHNDNCKHRRRLIAWIAEQEQSSQVQREVTAIADAQEAPAAMISQEQIEALYASMAEQDRHIAQLEEYAARQDKINAGYFNGLVHHRDRIDALERDAEATHAYNVGLFCAIDTRIAEDHTLIRELERQIAVLTQQLAQAQADITEVKAAKAPASRSKTTKAAPVTKVEKDAAIWDKLEKDLNNVAAKQAKRENATLHSKPFALES